MSDARQTGQTGEDLAVAFLEHLGYQVLERNYRFQREEIDVIAFAPNADHTGGELVFVEVKTRRGHGFGRPEEAVTPDKQARIVRTAQAYLHERHLTRGTFARFDVVAITLGAGDAQVEHFINAFGSW